MAARDDLVLTRRRLASLTAGAAPPEHPDAPDPAEPDEPRGRHAWRPPRPAPAPDPDEGLDVLGGVEHRDGPDEEPAAGVRVLRPRPGRGWQERWVPAGWRGHRWDPGRRGGLALAAVAAVAAVLAAVGVWRDRPVTEALPPLPVVESAPAATGSNSASPGPGPTVAPAAATTVPELVVSVVGAVPAPGLVRLPPGSRVADALAAAGGAVPGTDLLSLNLAAPVSDGEQVVVGAPGPPATGAAGPPPATGTAAAGSVPGAATAGGAVNLNTADVAALDTLPGVGPVTAQKIVDHRTSSGPFTSVDQLTEVPGIGDARLASLRDLVTV